MYPDITRDVRVLFQLDQQTQGGVVRTVEVLGINLCHSAKATESLLDWDLKPVLRWELLD